MSILVDVLKGIFAKKSLQNVDFLGDESAPVFLNVGGGSKAIPVSRYLSGWRHVLLDINPNTGAEVVLDARNLVVLPKNQFDAIYCSHNLEHYYHHDVRRVLDGFLHVLKDDGFVEIRVPDIGSLMPYVFEHQIGLHDILYESGAGPITAHDILWGYGKEIEESGEDFYAHKTGFTRLTLIDALRNAGFAKILELRPIGLFELHVIAFTHDKGSRWSELFDGDLL